MFNLAIESDHINDPSLAYLTGLNTQKQACTSLLNYNFYTTKRQDHHPSLKQTIPKQLHSLQSNLKTTSALNTRQLQRLHTKTDTHLLNSSPTNIFETPALRTISQK